jgi:hypothetical protein
MSKLKQTTGQAGGAEDARVMQNCVAPADTKPISDLLEEPLSRSVAEWFTARGRPISAETILQWKRAGWSDTSTADIVKPGRAARANSERAAAPNGDAGTNKAAAIGPNAKAKGAQKIAPLDLGNVELAEKALCTALTRATAVLESARDIATTNPGICAAGDKSDRRSLLEEEADYIAAITAAASKAIEAALEGLVQLAVLRAENAEAAPGATGGPSRH